MKSYSGKFVLRVTAQRHRELVGLAHQHNISLNQLCANLIQAGLKGHPVLPAWQAWFEKKLPLIKNKFGDALLGIAVFGSRVNETATQASDVDVLVCLRSDCPLNRTLYSWWDERIHHEDFEYNPVFLHLPQVTEASSLWYEITLNHRILYDRQKALKNIFDQLTQRVQNGFVQRKWLQGQPYWILESTT